MTVRTDCVSPLALHMDAPGMTLPVASTTLPAIWPRDVCAWSEPVRPNVNARARQSPAILNKLRNMVPPEVFVAWREIGSSRSIWGVWLKYELPIVQYRRTSSVVNRNVGEVVSKKGTSIPSTRCEGKVQDAKSSGHLFA